MALIRHKTTLFLLLSLCTLMLFVSKTTVYGEEEPAVWAREEINAARANGLVPDSLLSDYEAPISRADFCKSMIHLLTVTTGEDPEDMIRGKGLMIPISSPFIDIDDLNVTYAYILGITGGYPDKTFKPNASITRQEAAKMLSNTFYALDKVIVASPQVYADQGSISDWALEAIALVDAYDIMNGVGDNYFDPGGTYQRQMAILTMNRLFNNLDQAPNRDEAPTTPYHYLVYGLGNAGDYTMTFGASSYKLYSTEYQKDGMIFSRKLATNMYDESFEMAVYVIDERDYFAIPSLGKMVSYKTGDDATIISQIYNAVHHDLLSARISNNTYLFTYGVPFPQDDALLENYTFTMEEGEIVHLTKEFNGTLTQIPNITFNFEPLDEAMFQIPQDLEHLENNWVNDGEWAPFWWDQHSTDTF